MAWRLTLDVYKRQIYTSALYDLSGQLVADFQRLSYGETWNDFIMIYQNGEYLIKNMKTGEILQENIDLIQIADHAILVSTDYDQHQYQLYDLNLQPITKFTEYDEVSLYWNKLKERVFIARKGEKYGILNEQGQLILPIEYDQISEISNDYFIVQQGEEYLALDRNQDNTEVFRYPGRISYFDGEIAIAYQETEQDWDNVCMLNAAGDVLLEGYRTLMADSMINQEGGGSKANLFYGEKENEVGKPITQLMNRQGEILQEFDENTYLSIDQDQVLVSQYRFDCLLYTSRCV